MAKPKKQGEKEQGSSTNIRSEEGSGFESIPNTSRSSNSSGSRDEENYSKKKKMPLWKQAIGLAFILLVLLVGDEIYVNSTFAPEAIFQY